VGGYCSTDIAACAVKLNYRSLHDVNILEETFKVGCWEQCCGPQACDASVGTHSLQFQPLLYCSGSSISYKVLKVHM